MHKPIRHFAVGLSVALILALAVSDSSARNLSVTEQNIRVTWAPLTFDGEGMGEVRCNVTIEGSFEARTIVKNPGFQVGQITRAIVGRPCARNTAWAANGTERNEVLGGTFGNSLPWLFTYHSFTGTLPNITSIHMGLVNASFVVRVTTILGTILCQYTATHNNGLMAATATVTAGRIERLDADPTYRTRSETAGCPEGRFSGGGPVTALNSRTIVTLRLI